MASKKSEFKLIAGYQPQELIRKSRGKVQKIFLILTYEHDENILERKYEVMGTTGNVYTVDIKNKPTCTCPDYIKRQNRCKHIYFVLIKIMKVKNGEEDFNMYSDIDLERMFKNIPDITKNLTVAPEYLAKFKILKKNANGEVTQKEINEEDDCPICLGNMYECDEDIISCKYSCGSNIHKECFDMYNTKQHGQIKCLYCLQNWYNDVKQYINIA